MQRRRSNGLGQAAALDSRSSLKHAAGEGLFADGEVDGLGDWSMAVGIAERCCRK
jgi:hypothetical protein